MDLHSECLLSNYMVQIQRITGPFSAHQLDLFEDIVAIQKHRISIANNKRDIRELQNQSRNKRSKTRPAWLSPRQLEINYYEAGGDQGCGPFSSYKVTDYGFGTYAERTVRKCYHHYDSPRKENHESEAEKLKVATTAFEDLMSQYKRSSQKDEGTQTESQCKSIDMEKLKGIMKRAVRRLKDKASVVNVEEFLKLCAEEIECDIVKNEVQRKTGVRFDLNDRIINDQNRASSSHKMVETETSISPRNVDSFDDEKKILEARMTSVLEATLDACQQRLQKCLSSRDIHVNPKNQHVPFYDGHRSCSEASSEITDARAHYYGQAMTHYEPTYDNFDREANLTNIDNQKLNRNVQEIYRQHDYKESLPDKTFKKDKDTKNKNLKKNEKQSLELEQSTEVSFPSSLSYYTTESARPKIWTVEQGEMDFLDDHYHREDLVVPKLDLDFTRDDDSVRTSTQSGHTTFSSYWVSEESFSDWLKGKGVDVCKKRDWEEISIFSVPDQAEHGTKYEQENVETVKRNAKTAKEKIQALSQRQVFGELDGSSSDESSVYIPSAKELVQNQNDRTDRWAMATFKYTEFQQEHGDIDEFFDDEESNTMSDKGSSVATDWTSISQRKEKRCEENVIVNSAMNEVLYDIKQEVEKLQLENLIEVSSDRQALSTIEEVSFCEGDDLNFDDELSVCNDHSGWSKDQASFESSEKRLIDVFVSKDDNIDTTFTTYEDRYQERRQREIDELLAPDSSEEEFDIGNEVESQIEQKSNRQQKKLSGTVPTGFSPPSVGDQFSIRPNVSNVLHGTSEDFSKDIKATREDKIPTQNKLLKEATTEFEDVTLLSSADSSSSDSEESVKSVDISISDLLRSSRQQSETLSKNQTAQKEFENPKILNAMEVEFISSFASSNSLLSDHINIDSKLATKDPQDEEKKHIKMLKDSCEVELTDFSDDDSWTSHNEKEKHVDLGPNRSEPKHLTMNDAETEKDENTFHTEDNELNQVDISEVFSAEDVRSNKEVGSQKRADVENSDKYFHKVDKSEKLEQEETNEVNITDELIDIDEPWDSDEEEIIPSPQNIKQEAKYVDVNNELKDVGEPWDSDDEEISPQNNPHEIKKIDAEYVVEKHMDTQQDSVVQKLPSNENFSKCDDKESITMKQSLLVNDEAMESDMNEDDDPWDSDEEAEDSKSKQVKTQGIAMEQTVEVNDENKVCDVGEDDDPWDSDEEAEEYSKSKQVKTQRTVMEQTVEVNDENKVCDEGEEDDPWDSDEEVEETPKQVKTDGEMPYDNKECDQSEDDDPWDSDEEEQVTQQSNQVKADTGSEVRTSKEQQSTSQVSVQASQPATREAVGSLKPLPTHAEIQYTEKEQAQERREGSPRDYYDDEKTCDDVPGYDEYYIHDETVDAERELLIAMIEGRVPEEPSEAQVIDPYAYKYTDEVVYNDEIDLSPRTSEVDGTEEICDGLVSDTLPREEPHEVKTIDPYAYKYTDEVVYDENDLSPRTSEFAGEEEIYHGHVLDALSDDSVIDMPFHERQRLDSLAQRPLPYTPTALKPVKSPQSGTSRSGLLPLKNDNLMQGKQSFLEASKGIFAFEKSIAAASLQDSSSNLKYETQNQARLPLPIVQSPRVGMSEPLSPVTPHSPSLPRQKMLEPLRPLNDATTVPPHRQGILAPLSPISDSQTVPSHGALKPLASTGVEKAKKKDKSKKKKDRKEKKAKKQKEMPPVKAEGLGIAYHRNAPQSQLEGQGLQDALSQMGVIDIHQYDEEELEQLRDAMINYVYAQDDYYQDAQYEYGENPYDYINIPEEFQDNPEEYFRLLQELQDSPDGLHQMMDYAQYQSEEGHENIAYQNPHCNGYQANESELEYRRQQFRSSLERHHMGDDLVINNEYETTDSDRSGKNVNHNCKNKGGSGGKSKQNVGSKFVRMFTCGDWNMVK